MAVGGIHPVTASLRNALAAQGADFSEALLLGIGGGLGAGYILWEFKAHNSANIVLGFSNRWNYSVRFLTTLCERIGARTEMQETSGRKSAAANLDAALAGGQPFIAWVDKAFLPYQHLPEALKGYGVHVVGVHGRDNGTILLDDLADGLIATSADAFAEGRNSIPSDKNRILRVTAPGATDLPAAVRAGIADQLEHLGSDSESFSLPVYKKWAKQMTHPKDKKGWPTVFRTRVGLYDALRSIFEGVVFDGTDGGGLRGMYADFLDEAAGLLGQPALGEVAGRYRMLHDQWAALAEAALPSSVDAFAETKRLMRQRYEQFRARQFDALAETMAKLGALQAELNPTFPLDDAAVNALFADLGERLAGLYDAEVAALGALNAAFAD